MPDYREFRPPARLADAVECLWSMRCDPRATVLHRVLPDGCADILFTCDTESSVVKFVGPMTRFEDYALPAGRFLFGMRFRPGMWPALIGPPAHRLTDELLPLQDLWGARAREVEDRLADVTTPAGCAAILCASIPAVERRSPFQQALAYIELRRGCVPLEEIAGSTGLSVRQFRRLCLDQTGLSPKFLTRVLRFRHALSRVRAERRDHAGLAAECGYADQSHFIAEFRRLSGRTPGAF